jgi:UDP-glucose 6-dehydrogenase
MGFVYDSGKVEREGRASISDKIYAESQRLIRMLGIADRLMKRYRNITEGLGFGSYEFIKNLQELFNRKYKKPRKVTENERGEEMLFATRNLRDSET